MAATLQKKKGGSPEAIQHHYDVGNDFYAHWLDHRLIYSCALWDTADPADTLARAQYRKLEYHADQCRASQGDRILDVGCGWGAMLVHLLDERYASHVEGITLSKAQHRHLNDLDNDKLVANLCSWTDYQPSKTFDGIISIGAFEHFADPSQSRDEQRELYRHFFEKCSGWLKKDGHLSLQTIAYGNMEPSEANSFITNDIFPNAELPHLSDICCAAEGVLEVSMLRNDAVHYAKTCKVWAQNLRKAYSDDRSICFEDQYKKYVQYLNLSSMGFLMGKLQLLRITFSKPGWHRN